MKLIADEHVPTSLVAYLESRGHALQRTRPKLGPKAPDATIIQVADLECLTVITWNRSDFDRLIKPRVPGGPPRYPRAGVLYFCNVPYKDSASRLGQVIDLFDFEDAQSSSRGVRFSLLIADKYVQTWR